MHFIIDTMRYYMIASIIITINVTVILFFSRKYVFKFLLILFTPTTPINELSEEGKVELKGKIRAIKTMRSSELNKDLVFHQVIYENMDDDDNWQEFNREVKSLPFNLVDQLGDSVLIDVKDATFDLDKNKTEILYQGSYSRTKHSYLEDNEELYILGYYDSENRIITKKENVTFLISDSDESKLLFSNGLKGFGFLALAFLITIVSFSLAKSHYNESWSGIVVEKWIDDYEDNDGDDVFVYQLELEDGTVKTISKENWNNVVVGAVAIKYPREHRVKSFFLEDVKSDTKINKNVEKNNINSQDTKKSDTNLKKNINNNDILNNTPKDINNNDILNNTQKDNNILDDIGGN